MLSLVLIWTAECVFGLVKNAQVFSDSNFGIYFDTVQIFTKRLHHQYQLVKHGHET